MGEPGLFGAPLCPNEPLTLSLLDSMVQCYGMFEPSHLFIHWLILKKSEGKMRRERERERQTSERLAREMNCEEGGQRDGSQMKRWRKGRDGIRIQSPCVEPWEFPREHDCKSGDSPLAWPGLFGVGPVVVVALVGWGGRDFCCHLSAIKKEPSSSQSSGFMDWAEAVAEGGGGRKGKQTSPSSYLSHYQPCRPTAKAHGSSQGPDNLWARSARLAVPDCWNWATSPLYSIYPSCIETPFRYGS